jgi:hypothetical protein
MLKVMVLSINIGRCLWYQFIWVNEINYYLCFFVIEANMLLIAMGYGLGASESSFRRPMAALGGLVTSTLLRLLVISVAFIYMDDVKVWVLRLFGKPKLPSFDEHEISG